jgi:hypothetical protein
LPFVVANRLHVVPPTIMTPTEVDDGMAILDEGFAAAFS